MDNLQLNAIATRLLLDEEFQAALIHEHRCDCLTSFALAEHERRDILSIRAETPQQFLSELRKLIRPQSQSQSLTGQSRYKRLTSTFSSPARGTQSY